MKPAKIASIAWAIASAAVCHGQRELVIWNSGTGASRVGREAVFLEFERRHPDVRIKALSMTAGGLDPQKLLTSIAGGVPPDLVYQDRFLVAAWASRGALTPLDRFAQRDRVDMEAFVPSAVQECRWHGETFGIPVNADSRALYWNKALFSAAGLDPERPPTTWAELLSVCKRLTRFGPDGRASTVGFDPLYGGSTPYLYLVQAGGDLYEFGGLASPAASRAYQFIRDAYAVSGGFEAVRRCIQGAGPEPISAFATGRVAMKIDGDWSLSELRRVAPGLDFGVAAPPIPDPDTPVHPATWSGGNALVIPRGARNESDAWQFIVFATSLEALLVERTAMADAAARDGDIAIPKLSARIDDPVRSIELPQQFRNALEVHSRLLRQAVGRPVNPVNSTAWEELLRAGELASPAGSHVDAILTEASHRIALAQGLALQPRGPTVPDAAPWLVASCAVLLAGAGWIYRAIRNRGSRDRWTALAFLTPTLIGLAGWVLIPTLVSLQTSFLRSDGLSAATYAGLSNYGQLLGDARPDTVRVFFNAAYLSGIGVPLAVGTGLALALMLNGARSGLRAVVFSPAIVPPIVATMLWFWILQPDPSAGILNWLWNHTISSTLGYAAPDWFSSPDWAKDGLIAMGLWGAGGGILLWLAALRRVPQELLDSATLDGASSSQSFRWITWPAISPAVFFGLVAGFIGAMQEFDRPYLFHQDNGFAGPADALATPTYRVFTLGFRDFQFGAASAMAWLLVAVVLVVVGLQFASARWWVRVLPEEPQSR